MHVLIVTIQIQPNHREEFLEALIEDARGTDEEESGCLRFDILEDVEDPNRIYLYEVYADDAAVEVHRKAPHFLKWKSATQSWFAEPPKIQISKKFIYSANKDWIG
jgi:quinol monooxygenase YgiN